MFSINKKIITTLIVSILLITISQSIQVNSNKIETENLKFSENQEILSEKTTLFAPGELIIKFKNTPVLQKNSINTGFSMIDVLNRENQLQSIKTINTKNKASTLSNTYRYIFPENKDIKQLIDEYEMDPNVEYAEPNYYCYLEEIPNDPSFNLQWSLDQQNDCDIDAPEAWDIETGDKNVVIAILDTGVEVNHSDLESNIWTNNDEIPDNGIDDDQNGFIDDVHGWDFAYGRNNVWDNNGHGTHCAGIAGAIGNNDNGIAGICWNCTIMPVRVLPGFGMPFHLLVEGVNYAIDNGADILSMSIGVYGYSKTLDDLFEYADQQGVVVVAAAGNDDKDEPHYPSSYKKIISVAATDQNDNRADFSNYGTDVDISAPGVKIYSTKRYQGYCTKSGTSMSAPHVAGAAGLLISKYPDITPEIVKTMLYNSVDEIDTDESIGHGRLNIYNALQKKPVASILDKISEKKSTTGLLKINGSSYGQDFHYYKIMYKNKNSNNLWQEITESYQEVEKSILATWDTTQVADGNYIIKLITFTDTDEYMDQIEIFVNNEINTLYVGGNNPDNYDTIQEAINNAEENDIIYVSNGIYEEYFKIDKPIKLIGENNENTIINIDDNEGFVNISSNYVKISNFFIKKYISNMPAIQLLSDYCEISNNIIDSFSIGIRIYKSKNFKVSSNTFQNIISTSITGEYYSGTFSNNIFKSCGRWELITRCCDNQIFNNVFQNGSKGIYMNNRCNYNSIRNNNFNNHSDNGIRIDKFYNYFNNIYQNNFINSQNNLKVLDGSNEALIYNETNYWDNGEHGNYYDYYQGFDENQDGIGDTPYKITNVSIDNYPLMTAWQKNSNPPAKPEKPDGPRKIGKNKFAYFSTKSTDPEEEIIKYGWDWNNDNIVDNWTEYAKSGEPQEIETKFKETGILKIKVKAKDQYGYQSPWSETYTITVSKSKSKTKPVFTPLVNLLMKIFPNLFILIQKIINK